MRVLLIIVLLLQILFAQAIASSHAHGFPDSRATSSQADFASGTQAVAQARDHQAHQTGHSDAFHADENCCCAFTGHCSSSAVIAQASQGTPFAPVAHGTWRVRAGLARGFDSPPYRPPSPR
jgi:hypothetical protein